IGGIFEHHRIIQGGATAENNTLHVMDNQSRIATRRVGAPFGGDVTPAIKFALGDHLGSSNVVLDTSGGLINREEYTPYGETAFGSFARKRYRFTGKERDEESGLSYHGARYYATWLMKWSSCDPLGIIDGLNLYTYAQNSPTNIRDPSGTQSEPWNDDGGGAEGGGPGGDTSASSDDPVVPETIVVEQPAKPTIQELMREYGPPQPECHSAPKPPEPKNVPTVRQGSKDDMSGLTPQQEVELRMKMLAQGSDNPLATLFYLIRSQQTDDPRDLAVATEFGNFIWSVAKAFGSAGAARSFYHADLVPGIRPTVSGAPVNWSSGTSAIPGSTAAANSNGKGYFGEERSYIDILNVEGTPIGRQVTFEGPNGDRIKLDWVWVDKYGNLRGTESKFGASADFTSNQRKVFPQAEF